MEYFGGILELSKTFLKMLILNNSKTLKHPSNHRNSLDDAAPFGTLVEQFKRFA